MYFYCPHCGVLGSVMKHGSNTSKKALDSNFCKNKTTGLMIKNVHGTTGTNPGEDRASKKNHRRRRGISQKTWKRKDQQIQRLTMREEQEERRPRGEDHARLNRGKSTIKVSNDSRKNYKRILNIMWAGQKICTARTVENIEPKRNKQTLKRTHMEVEHTTVIKLTIIDGNTAATSFPPCKRPMEQDKKVKPPWNGDVQNSH